MPLPQVRRLLAAALAAAGIAGLTVALAPVAAAATPFTAGNPRVVLGDVTGDGVADRVTIGYVGVASALRCAVEVRAGLGDSRWGKAAVVRVPVRGVEFACPDLGVVVRGPDPTRNRLALTFFQAPPSDPALGVQLFALDAMKTFVARGTLAGTPQPSAIGSRDFNGDGWGDVWETTDQGLGFQSFLGRGGSWWRELYSTPFTSGAIAQFVDLNHRGGTDILVTWADLGQGSGVAVVDGRTGATQILAAGASADAISYSASVVDLDHNAFLDLQITGEDFDGVRTTHRFLNRSQDGRWLFRDPAATG